MIASYDWTSDSFTQHIATSAQVAFRTAVLQVADKAKLVLEANASRIDKAVALVLNGFVEIVDGKCRVASQTNGKTIYHQVNGTCTCLDFTQGKAPNGFCKHRLAHGLYRRAMELVHVQEPIVEAQSKVTAETVQVPVQHTEAPASVNFHTTLAGRQVQITLRETDETRLLARLETLLQRFSVIEEPKESAQREGWCYKHNVQMKLNHGKRGSWWSHKTADGQWCNKK
jgi:UTP:GlnB (protein PII) uridylyltransferase